MTLAPFTDKTAPASATSRHITRQPRSPEQLFRPPDFRHTRRFHPPETKPPSQYRQNTPISTTIPIFGGRNCTGRVKTSPKRARTVKDVGVTPGTTGQSFVRLGGGKFRPSGCGGHKNSENVATFSKFLGREEKSLPRDLDFLSYTCALILSGICQEKFVRQKC